MKTPKDILFARHRAAEEKLDAIRNETVAAMHDRHAHRNSTTIAERGYNTLSLLRELFRLRPQTWAGLAAVWILIFALKISTHDGSHVVATKSSISPEVLAEVRQQKLLFFELADLRDARNAEPPKPFFLRPRSELRDETFAA
jgi:hypothetical protein